MQRVRVQAHFSHFNATACSLSMPRHYKQQRNQNSSYSASNGNNSDVDSSNTGEEIK